jgi:hypothetical protein
VKRRLAAADDTRVNELERLMAEIYDDGVVEEIIRPAAIVPEEAARLVLVELSLRHVDAGGEWEATPTTWHRYDGPRDPDSATPMGARLVGTLQVAYGTPTRYDITIYRATVTRLGTDTGWTVESLCDEALGFGGLSLARCPRAALTPPPPRFPT